jgi:hypothetical protein
MQYCSCFLGPRRQPHDMQRGAQAAETDTSGRLASLLDLGIGDPIRG